MEITEVYSNEYLGTYYQIEDDSSILMLVVKDSKVMLVPSWEYGSITANISGSKFERKALKAFKDSEFNR